MNTRVVEVKEIMQDQGNYGPEWTAKAVINDDNMTYFVAYHPTKEIFIVDPMKEDFNVLMELVQSFPQYRVVAVHDTHTHADHLSCAAELAEATQSPLVMGATSPSKKIHIRITRDTVYPTVQSNLKIYLTPGHTPDGLTPVWGPFVFAGDTLLYGDAGRDDLPGGNPEAHWDSLQKLKGILKPEMIFLPGHDSPGRVSTWKTQLEICPALKQNKAEYIADSGSWVGPSPKLLKESLAWNFK